MRTRGIAALGYTAALLGLVACGSNVQDPQLAMCQAVAKQLTDQAVAGWERVDQTDRFRNRQISIDYSTVDDRSGNISCNFPIEENGTVASAPDRVNLNGEPVAAKQLITAGLAASKELIAGTAAETAAKVREVAGDVSETALDVANQTGEAAREALHQASDRAREVAGQAVGSAVEAGQALQEKLEQ